MAMVRREYFYYFTKMMLTDHLTVDLDVTTTKECWRPAIKIQCLFYLVSKVIATPELEYRDNTGQLQRFDVLHHPIPCIRMITVFQLMDASIRLSNYQNYLPTWLNTAISGRQCPRPRSRTPT